MRHYWLALLAFLVFLAGAAYRISAASPDLSVISPPSQSTIYGQEVAVKFAVSDFKLTDFTSASRLVAGLGHIHLWLDTESLTKESAIKLTTDSYTFQNLKSGNHLLTAELVTSNHVSLTPPVITTLEFSTQTLPAVSRSSLLSSAMFQLMVLTVVLLIFALYFANLHIKGAFSPAPKTKVTSKAKAKKKAK